MTDAYFFDHLQDDITEDNHGEGKGYNSFNEVNAESNDDFVDPVHDVLGASNDESPQKSIMKPLFKKQLAKITTSDVPMNLRKSPPERLIDKSTTQKISLTLPNTNLSTSLVACSAKKTVHNQSSESSEEDSKEEKISSKKPKTTKTLEALCTKATFNLQLSLSSEESKTDSQFNAKYEANMRAFGHALCNWQFEKCYLTNRPAMHCRFKDGCSNFAHKRCSILWSRTHRRNVEGIESIGRFCQEHYMDYNKEVLPTQTNNGTDCIWAWPNTERDHEWSEEDVIEFTANGLWFAPDCKKCFGTNKNLTHGDKLCGHTRRPHRLD